MYSPQARALRRCTARRKDGQPCNAWALWDDARQLCVRHARGGRGPDLTPAERWARSERTRATPCRCAAYRWPHRPGAGLCRWPEPPLAQCPTPAGTPAWPRLRGRLRPLKRVRRV